MITSRPVRKRTSVGTRSSDFVYFDKLDTSNHIEAPYDLNKTKCLNKKLNSCCKEPLNIEKIQTYTLITCSTAALEVVRLYLNNLDDSYEIKSTVKYDGSKSIESICLQFHEIKGASPKNKKNLIGRSHFTVNIYLTTCRLLINGKYLKMFNTRILPALIEFVNVNYVQEMDKTLESVISASLKKEDYVKFNHKSDKLDDRLDDAKISSVIDTNANVVVDTCIHVNGSLPLPTCSIPSSHESPQHSTNVIVEPVAQSEILTSSEYTQCHESPQLSTNVIAESVSVSEIFTCNTPKNVPTVKMIPKKINTNDSVIIDIDLEQDNLNGSSDEEDIFYDVDEHLPMAKKKPITKRSSKIRKSKCSPVNKSVRSLNNKIDGISDSLADINNQFVINTDKFSNLEIKFNERCKQLDNAISNTNKKIDKKLDGMRTNFDAMTNVQSMVSNSVPSIIPDLVEESVNKINFEMKKLDREIVNIRSSLHKEKSQIVGEVLTDVSNTLNLDDRLKNMELNLNAFRSELGAFRDEFTLQHDVTLSAVKALNDRINNEKHEINNLIITMDSRINCSGEHLQSLQRQLNVLSERLDKQITSSCSDPVLPSSSVPIWPTSSEKKHFNPMYSKTLFNSSTHRLFRGSKDPLSNMYMHAHCGKKCKIQVFSHGVSGLFDNSEMAFTYFKALFNNRFDLLPEIVNCSTSWECKDIGDEIITGDHWLNIREQVMMDIQLSKYNCCLQFRKSIHNNRSKHIMENTSESFWGVGYDYKGNNALGKIHMKLIDLIYNSV